MISPEILDILRCPACDRGGKAVLTLVTETWLICGDCGRKYPIIDDLPHMLIEIGDRWIDTTADALPVPPPKVD